MARNRRRRTGGIVTLLLLAVCGFLILCSVQEKYGYDFGLPTLNLPDLEEVFGPVEPPAPKPVSPSGPADTPLRDGLEVHHIDVGQGDSILLLAPGSAVLIDAGENDMGDTVIRYLREQGVARLDLVIGTHPHSDHIGGLDTVIETMPVDRVILPVIPEAIVPTTVTYTDLLEAIADKGLTITPAQPGDCYDLGDGAVLEILGPLADYTDLNDMSVVCRVQYGSTSFLFTGDAEKGAEKDLLEQGGLASTVLSLGHHGSGTSSSAAFLQAVAPKVAVISCGRDNSYGHPHREVLERLEELGARVLRTDLDGSVVLTSDGESVGIAVERDKIAS